MKSLNQKMLFLSLGLIVSPFSLLVNAGPQQKNLIYLPEGSEKYITNEVEKLPVAGATNQATASVLSLINNNNSTANLFSSAKSPNIFRNKQDLSATIAIWRSALERTQDIIDGNFKNNRVLNEALFICTSASNMLNTAIRASHQIIDGRALIGDFRNNYLTALYSNDQPLTQANQKLSQYLKTLRDKSRKLIIEIQNITDGKGWYATEGRRIDDQRRKISEAINTQITIKVAALCQLLVQGSLRALDRINTNYQFQPNR